MKKTEFEYSYIGECLMCNEAFKPRSVFLLDRTQEKSEVHAECNKCKSAAFIHIIRNKDHINVVPMPTDMSKDDIIRLRKMEPITESEVRAVDKIG